MISTASDDAQEEKALKDAEREKVWANATSQRQKWVTFLFPRSFTEKETDAVFQQSIAYAWEGKAAEKHRTFLFSSDLVHESDGPSWAKVPEWKEDLGSACCKFMASKVGHADLLIFADGRSRACRKALEKAKGDSISDDEVWRFLRCLVVVHFQLEHAGARDSTQA